VIFRATAVRPAFSVPDFNIQFSDSWLVLRGHFLAASFGGRNFGRQSCFLFREALAAENGTLERKKPPHA
jgi:hypothetical protein